MTALVHKVTKNPAWFGTLGINTQRMGAKDRRRAMEALYGSWFRDNGLKLTRDFMVEIKNNRTNAASYWNNSDIIISIRDPQKAMLFKLTWV